MIVARDLRKCFGSICAVDDVSFDAADGEVTGLLGPNGAGKTTVLRMIFGLVRPEAGSVEVDGIRVADKPLVTGRRIGALPDAAGLYPRLTARENIRYFGRLHGLGGAALERRIDGLIELLGLEAVADRATAGFSQGERMKVCLARAIVHDPRHVLLDEPTNGLDVMSTRAIRELIRQLKAEGRCVLFSSHIMQEVSALCDRIVVIAGGRTVAAGTPDELRTATGADSLEEAFVSLIGSGKGLT